jgi:hypothetical protein|tara:strand:- start:192 stop:476 length:285 start_codon:yes stop_codon:yes gene_type:complete
MRTAYIRHNQKEWDELTVSEQSDEQYIMEMNRIIEEQKELAASLDTDEIIRRLDEFKGLVHLDGDDRIDIYIYTEILKARGLPSHSRLRYHIWS